MVGIGAGAVVGVVVVVVNPSHGSTFLFWWGL